MVARTWPDGQVVTAPLRGVTQAEAEDYVAAFNAANFGGTYSLVSA